MVEGRLWKCPDFGKVAFGGAHPFGSAQSSGDAQAAFGRSLSEGHQDDGADDDDADDDDAADD
eukprot:11657439-Karenia_brevis.AAC.1